MPENGKIVELTDSLKEYIHTTYELKKLQAIEKSSVFGASLIGILLTGLVVILFVVFLSLWVALYLSAKMGDIYSGFSIVSAFYFLLGIILLLVRKKLIDKPMRDKIIRRIFTDN